MPEKMQLPSSLLLSPVAASHAATATVAVAVTRCRSALEYVACPFPFLTMHAYCSCSCICNVQARANFYLMTAAATAVVAIPLLGVLREQKLLAVSLLRKSNIQFCKDCVIPCIFIYVFID